jgi:hypothetical protein
LRARTALPSAFSCEGPGRRDDYILLVSSELFFCLSYSSQSTPSCAFQYSIFKPVASI